MGEGRVRVAKKQFAGNAGVHFPPCFERPRLFFHDPRAASRTGMTKRRSVGMPDNEIMQAGPGYGIHLNFAARQSNNVGPPQFGVALNRNSNLRNAKNTKFLKNITVPGIVNSPKRAPNKHERALKAALGL